MHGAYDLSFLTFVQTTESVNKPIHVEHNDVS